MKYDEFIHDRGRGPEIKGTRITVYAILDFLLAGWNRERIADQFKVHPEEVEAATEYIREHTLEVMREYVKILERSERGNPPELQAKLDASHERFLELVSRVREAKSRGDTNVRAIIEEYRQARAQEAVNARNHGGQ
jgi:uncharacterized protein (DUF433 family)